MNGAFRDELTVTYEAPKPEKKVFTKQDLYESDLFGFGSIIGSITNKGTNAFALLPLLEDAYGKDSDEVNLVISRLRQCCVAQSKAIDRTKIGRPVKGIPDDWITRKQILPSDTPDEVAQKELLNRCLINKRPYFFKYRYSDSKKKYDEYKKSRDNLCQSLFGVSLDELINAPRKTREQHEWLKNYYEYSPLVESDSAMNLVCKYIEQIDFQISQRVKSSDGFSPTVYIDDEQCGWEEYLDDVVKTYKRFVRDNFNGQYDASKYDWLMERLREQLSYVCSNPIVVTNCLVKYLLIDQNRKDIDTLWDGFGRWMVKAALKNNDHPVMFPFPDENGEVLYLEERYASKEVSFD